MVDLSKITYREYRRFFETGLTIEEECAILAKAFGMTTDEVADLPMIEWKRLVLELSRAASEPLADPN